MEANRDLELKTLSENIELTLQHQNDKFIAFTKNGENFDVMPIINSLIDNFSKNNKVAVLSYDKVSVSSKATNIVIDAFNDTRETVIEKCNDFDLVIVICPSVIEKNHYLHMAKFVNLVAIIAKKWKTKTKDILEMKQKFEEQGMNIIGIIYQN